MNTFLKHYRLANVKVPSWKGLVKESHKYLHIADNKQTGSLDYKVTYLECDSIQHSKIEHRGG